MIRKIALYGKSGHGKDYLCEALIEEIGLVTPYLAARFAFADKIKEQLSILLGFNDEQRIRFLHDPDFKNNTYVRMDSLETVYMDPEIADDYKKRTEFLGEEDTSIRTADELNSHIEYGFITDEKPNRKDLISLRELLVYYGTYVMQKRFGKNVWISSVFNDKRFREAESDPDGFHVIIVTDVRFKKEYDALREKGFKFVKVELDPKYVKKEVKNVAESFYSTFEPDYTFINYHEQDVFNDRLSSLVHWLIEND